MCEGNKGCIYRFCVFGGESFLLHFFAHGKYDLNAAVYCSALTEERKEEKHILILVWSVVLSVVQEQTESK